MLGLWRPFISETPGRRFDQALTTEASSSIKASAEVIFAGSIKEMRQLLVRHEVLYGGLGVHNVLATPLLALVYDAMPTASPSSSEYSLSAHMGFLTALRMLVRLSRSIPAMNLIILGIKQSAVRTSLSLPPESDVYFRQVSAAARDTSVQCSANWVVDLSRSTTDVESTRLGNMVTEMRNLNILEHK
jgi:hypothetical protein